jgi:hypothetical protein
MSPGVYCWAKNTQIDCVQFWCATIALYGQPYAGAAQLAIVGAGVGATVGSGVGANVGSGVGSGVGGVGSGVGGTGVGAGVGESVGESVGVTVGEAVGASVGESVGTDVGASVGVSVGATVGDAVGESVGESVGTVVGESVGTSVGESVGAGVVGSGLPKIIFPMYLVRQRKCCVIVTVYRILFVTVCIVMITMIGVFKEKNGKTFVVDAPLRPNANATSTPIIVSNLTFFFLFLKKNRFEYNGPSMVKIPDAPTRYLCQRIKKVKYQEKIIKEVFD